MSQSTMNTKPSDGLLALFKGDSGVGKTVAALSFPEPYIMDFDRKMPGVARKHWPQKDIQYDTFTHFEEVIEKLEEFKNHCPYDTIIVDSFTTACNLIFETTGQVADDTVPRQFQRFKEQRDPKKKSQLIEPISMQYYQAEVRWADYLTSQLKTLQIRPGKPRYVIVIAHVIQVDSNPNPLKNNFVTTTFRDIVSKGRKVGAALQVEFDDVYVFGTYRENQLDPNSTPRRICLTQNFGQDTAKCSLNIPPMIDITTDPLYDQLFNRASISQSISRAS